VLVKLVRKSRSSLSGYMLAHVTRFGHPLFCARIGLCLGFCLLSLVARSDPFSTAWSESGQGKSQMRLIVGTPRTGHYAAAAEVKLAGEAITYWRTPGDAGVPPSFSFAGSENLGAADVAYPAPIRMNEQGLEAFGYRHDVVFPIAIRARDASKPVRLRLAMNYAVCDNICLPARGVAELQLPLSGTSPEDSKLADASTHIPISLTKDAIAKNIVIVASTSTPQPQWILTWKAEAPTDLFAEAPDGFDVETHALGGGRFAVIASPPPHFSRLAPTQFTLTTPEKAYAFSLNLDLPAQALSSKGTK
jgi:DsbC/DsbD-like thiol-disulfide interchange protein